MATNIRVQKHLSKGNQGIAEPAQNQQPGSDLTNYKGIYFAEEPGQKFQEKSTGAHFEFIDMCRRLNIAQEQRKRREARERATEDINRGEEEDIGRMQEKMRSKLKESRDQQFMNRRESDREASSRNIIHGGLPQQGFGTVGGPLQHPLPTYGHAGGEQVIHKSMDQGSFDKIAIHGNTQNPKLHSKVPSIVRRGGNRDPGYSLRLPRSKEGDKAADSGDINCNININPNIEQRKRGNNSSIIERVPNLIRHKAELEMILANKTVNRKHIDRNNSLKQSASFKQTSTTVDTMNTGYGDNSGGYLNQGNTNNEEGSVIYIIYYLGLMQIINHLKTAIQRSWSVKKKKKKVSQGRREQLTPRRPSAHICRIYIYIYIYITSIGCKDTNKGLTSSN